MASEGKRKFYYIEDQETFSIVPLPSKFLKHMYRHYYAVKLAEMHLDDWTIAKLLGHNNLKNVKYYRKMSNQLLADDTRKARAELSERILRNLDGWEDEYEQIRYDGCLQP